MGWWLLGTAGQQHTWAHQHPAVIVIHLVLGQTGEIQGRYRGPQGSTGEHSSLAMEDIFHFIREGNAMQVRMWLDDTEHDMNQG